MQLPLQLLPEAFRLEPPPGSGVGVGAGAGAGAGVGAIPPLLSPAPPPFGWARFRPLLPPRPVVVVRLVVHRWPKELIRDRNTIARVVRPVMSLPSRDRRSLNLVWWALFLVCNRLSELCRARVEVVVRRVEVVPLLVVAPRPVTRPLTVERCLSWPTDAPNAPVVLSVVPVLAWSNVL